MASIRFRIPPEDSDNLIARLFDVEIAGAIEGEENVRVFFPPGVDVEEIAQRYGGELVNDSEDEPAFTNSPPQDWEGVLVGERFFIAPSWVDAPVPEGRIRLTIDATLAFGTGRHESTQLVLQALERYLKPGAALLDVGCGSGILSLAASRLGAGHLCSCDIDSNAIATARTYLESPLFQGTVAAVRTGFSDITVANISALVIDEIAVELNRVTRPGGLLILAGFIGDSEPAQFTPEARFDKSGWQCWICRPVSPASTPDPSLLHSHPAGDRWWD